MNEAPITAETITAILDQLRVPVELHTDPQLQAIAYGFAFLNAPATPAEARFYNATTSFYSEEDLDEGFPARYEVNNRDLMAEQLSYRASIRIGELAHSDADDAVNLR
ncbi:hypothetical protein ACIQC5_19860 [Paenarthrobacter sp. NPDC092416]|uniref:hypothetical protein n=1 Tax=Paenarthrobacter sp. NPDC092416 TaxID=3364386 RepID=UPI00382C0CD6